MREATHQQATSADILCIGEDESLARSLQQALGENCVCEQATSTFSAGMLVARYAPPCVVIDCDIGSTAVYSTVTTLQHKVSMANAVIIGLLGEGDTMEESDRNLFTEVFQKPCDVTHVATQVKKH